MKYTIHEDPQLAPGVSYEKAPTFADGDIVDLVTVDGDSHLFIAKRTEGGEDDCKYCEANRAISCMKYWFSCVGTHLKQLDTIMEDL